jgi:hypothetical protein
VSLEESDSSPSLSQRVSAIIHIWARQIDVREGAGQSRPTLAERLRFLATPIGVDLMTAESTTPVFPEFFSSRIVAFGVASSPSRAKKRRRFVFKNRFLATLAKRPPRSGEQETRGAGSGEFVS